MLLLKSVYVKGSIQEKEGEKDPPSVGLLPKWLRSQAEAEKQEFLVSHTGALSSSLLSQFAGSRVGSRVSRTQDA